MKYNFTISILFSLPFVETLTWAQVSGCLCQTFHHAGVCSCRGGTQGLLPQLGKSWELWELQSPSRSTSHLMQKDPKDPKDPKSTSESQDVSGGFWVSTN